MLESYSVCWKLCSDVNPFKHNGTTHGYDRPALHLTLTFERDWDVSSWKEEGQGLT